MIITVDRFKSIEAYSSLNEEQCIAKIKAIEAIIRAYTHNNFQNTKIRFYAQSKDGCLIGSHPFIRVGDTIQISESVNDGLYTIASIEDERIGLFKADDIYDFDRNLITKVEYPFNVQEGVMNLLEWESTNRKKVGIKSETISRHSVTYYDQDVNNTVMGYPAALMAFLEPYMKPRY